ncbi:hypothetical protein EBZ80_01125 [bacterium]|nr:hypothetical protein [bacterium]
MECPICCERFNRRDRTAIACLFCNHTACRRCLETFLLENERQCMACRHAWDQEFLWQHMTKKFMRAFRERQKTLLLAEAEAAVQTLEPAARRQIELEELAAEIAQRRREIQRLVARKNRIARSPIGDGITAGIFPCPDNACRGRLGMNDRCGLCDRRFCRECHREAGDGHACAEEDRETVALLREDTRPCPGCNQGIFKTEGCDQMWCVSCHTAFSWSTGRVIRGTIHNPHFYEHRRRVANGGAPMRNLGDIPCGGMPTVAEVIRRLDSLFQEDADEIDHMDRALGYYRIASHVNDKLMPVVHRQFQNGEAVVRELGIRFLRNRITRDKWRDALYARRLREEKHRRYYEILETMSHTLAELFRQLVVDRTASETVARCDGLFEALNGDLAVLRERYKMRIPVFSPEMDLEQD